MSNYSQEVLDKAVELKKSGYSNNEICIQTGLPRTTMQKYFNQIGLKLTNEERRAAHRKFDSETCLLIEKLYIEGSSVLDIRNKTGVPDNSIIHYLKTQNLYQVKAPIFTEEEKKLIIEEYQKGKPVSEIAATIERSKNGVVEVLREVNIYAPKHYEKRGPEFIAKLIEFRKNGVKILEIARVLGISASLAGKLCATHCGKDVLRGAKCE